MSQVPALPPGWNVRFQPGSGRPYYVNTATGYAQWEIPTFGNFLSVPQYAPQAPQAPPVPLAPFVPPAPYTSYAPAMPQLNYGVNQAPIAGVLPNQVPQMYGQAPQTSVPGGPAPWNQVSPNYCQAPHASVPGGPPAWNQVPPVYSQPPQATLPGGPPAWNQVLPSYGQHPQAPPQPNGPYPLFTTPASFVPPFAPPVPPAPAPNYSQYGPMPNYPPPPPPVQSYQNPVQNYQIPPTQASFPAPPQQMYTPFPQQNFPPQSQVQPLQEEQGVNQQGGLAFAPGPVPAPEPSPEPAREAHRRRRDSAESNHSARSVIERRPTEWTSDKIARLREGWLADDTTPSNDNGVEDEAVQYTPPPSKDGDEEQVETVEDAEFSRVASIIKTTGFPSPTPDSDASSRTSTPRRRSSVKANEPMSKPPLSLAAMDAMIISRPQGWWPDNPNLKVHDAIFSRYRKLINSGSLALQQRQAVEMLRYFTHAIAAAEIHPSLTSKLSEPAESMIDQLQRHGPNMVERFRQLCAKRTMLVEKYKAALKGPERGNSQRPWFPIENLPPRASSPI